MEPSHQLSKMTSDASLSGTSKRAKKKAAAAAAAAASSVVANPEPTGSVHELDNEDKKHANPYIDVVSKKLRALRKKAQKLEKYDQMDRKDLNADQILSLEKRPELIGQLKELEEVIKALTTVDVEEAEVAKRRLKAHEAEIAAKVAAAVNEANEVNALKGRATIRLLYALQNTLLNIATSTVVLTEEEYTALNSLRAYITGVGLEVDDAIKYIDVAEVYLFKYLNREEEEFVNRLTYANLHDLVDRLLEPPTAPSFVAEEEPNSVHAGTEAIDTTRSLQFGSATEEVVELQQVAQDPAAAGTAASTMISFFNPSEVISEDVRYAETTSEFNGVDVTNDKNDEQTVTEAISESQQLESPSPEIAAAYESASAPEPASTPQQPHANGVHRNNSYRGGRGKNGFRGGRGGYQPRYDSNNQQFQHHSPQQQQRVQQPRSHSFNNRSSFQGKPNGSPGGGFRGSPQQPQGVRN